MISSNNRCPFPFSHEKSALHPGLSSTAAWNVENTLAVRGENHYRPAAHSDMRNHLATALPCLAVSSRSSNMRHRWMASISIAVRGENHHRPAAPMRTSYSAVAEFYLTILLFCHQDKINFPRHFLIHFYYILFW